MNEDKKIIRLTKKIGILFSIFCLAFFLRTYSIGSQDLYFDEGAAWYVATQHSYAELISGQYTHVGDMPIPYILMKPWFSVFESEFFVRFYFVLAGLLSILVFYKILSLVANWSFAALGSLLMTINPVHIEYSTIVRSYIIGYLFQSLVVYFLLKLILRDDINQKKNLFYLFIFSLLAIFSNFSSFYLISLAILFIFSLLIFPRFGQILNLKIKKELFFKLLSLFILVLVAGFVWLLPYLNSSYGKLGMVSYASFKNRNILSYSLEIPQNMIAFSNDWKGYPSEYINLSYMSTKLSLLFFLFLLAYTLDSFITFNKKNVASHFLFLLSIFTSALALFFSIYFFNVMTIRLMLYLLIPYLYFVSQLITNLIKTKNYILSFFVFLFVVVISLLNTQNNHLTYNYPSESIFLSMVNKIGDKTLLVVSQDFSYDLFEFYSKLHKVNLSKSIDIANINIHDPSSIEKVKTEILSSSNFPENYKYIYYFGYYDDWGDHFPDSYNSFMSKIENYHKDTFVGNTEFFYFDFYERPY